ncbi:Serine protease OS=Streptomyces microflavus OX=1919 GN=G3I39_26595 PE=4 SV=1 [Streptomyces microflavus]
MLLVAWLIALPLARTSLPTLGEEVRDFLVLLGISRVMPRRAPPWFEDFSSALADYPQVFSPFDNEPITNVEPPDPALAGSPVAARAKKSIVKVVGTAPSCGKVLEGTTVVFSDRRVMTNAHVVGGVEEPTCRSAAKAGCTTRRSSPTTGSATSRCWTSPI